MFNEASRTADPDGLPEKTISPLGANVQVSAKAIRGTSVNPARQISSNNNRLIGTPHS
jgi:hypothetical protein